MSGADTTEQDAYHELCAYTLSHGGSEFLHQHVVDAYAAQQANAETRPIQLAFALIGLFLHVERRTSGREIQRVHRVLASRSKTWPTFPMPVNRGAITVADVLRSPAGLGRDATIDAWCAAVWLAYRENEPIVKALLEQHEVI